MKDVWIFVMCGVLLGASYGCNSEDDEAPDGLNMIIVEAYVHSGEPVHNIRLSKMSSEGLANSPAVSQADVKIHWEGGEFALTPHSSIPGRYDGDSLHTIPDAGTIHLQIRHYDRQYTAQSTIPAPITGLELSQNVISLQGAQADETLVVLSWDELGPGIKYGLFIRNLPTGATPGGPISSGVQGNPFYQLSDGNQIELKAEHFSYTGLYELYVTAVNQEYIDLFGGGQPSSMRNAPSNVVNGLGVFTAFNGSSITLHVQ